MQNIAHALREQEITMKSCRPPTHQSDVQLERCTNIKIKAANVSVVFHPCADESTFNGIWHRVGIQNYSELQNVITWLHLQGFRRTVCVYKHSALGTDSGPVHALQNLSDIPVKIKQTPPPWSSTHCLCNAESMQFKPHVSSFHSGPWP